MARSYSSWDEFEREELRPCFRIGFLIEDLEDLVYDGTQYDETEDDQDEDDFEDLFYRRYR